MRTAPIGGTEGRKRKQTRSIYNENTFLETASKNKKFQPFFDFSRVRGVFGLKAAKLFSVRTAPIGGTKGRKRKESHSVFDENTFLETASKNKIFNLFFIFFGSKNFWTSKRPSLYSAHGPYSVHQGPKKKKNRSVFDDRTFFETAAKSKIFKSFTIFSGPILFCRLGP